MVYRSPSKLSLSQSLSVRLHQFQLDPVNYSAAKPNKKPMSTPSRFLRGSRALFAASRAAAPSPKPNISPPASKKPANTAAVVSKLPRSSKEKKTSNSGIMKATPVSLTLQSVVGAPEISRVEAVKKIWEYIKLHNLQNPSDKREIFCDAKLKKLFNGKDKVGFLEIAKLLSPHFVKTN